MKASFNKSDVFGGTRYKESEMKIRPFKTIKEFIEYTNLGLGCIFYFKSKHSDKEVTKVVFLAYIKFLDDRLLLKFSTDTYELSELAEGYAYSKDGKKWKSFGIEE